MKTRLMNMLRSIFTSCIHVVKRLFSRKRKVTLRNEFFDYYAMYHLS